MEEKHRQRFLNMVTKHGLRYTSEYGIWLNIRQRCRNPKNNSYKYYGARGIKVCDRWDDFEKFYEDVGERPTPMHQLDRIDNNDDYKPGNCRWVLHTRNMRNRRDSYYWVVDGVRYESLGHAATTLSKPPSTIQKWCEGRGDGRYKYPPKINCWKEKKYD